MSDFLYNIRKLKNRIKRRYTRPAGGQFDSMEYTKSFKIGTVIIVGIVIIGIAAAVLYFTGVIGTRGIPVSLEATATPDITPEPTPAPTPEPTPEITPQPTMVPGPTPKIPGDAAAPVPIEDDAQVIEVGWIDGDLINVRTGPSAQYDRIGVLPQDSIVEVLEKDRWLKIKFLSGAGYVTSRYYVEGYYPLSDAQAQELASQPTAPPTNRIVDPEREYSSATSQIHVDKVKEDGQQFVVAEIWCEPENMGSFMVSPELDRNERLVPTAMARQANAVLAINGDFVSYHDKGVAIRSGEILRDSQDYEMLVLYSDGRMEGIKPETMTAQQMVDAGVVECWSAGPILVNSGAAYDDFTGRSNIKPPNPRTGIGMIEPGHYIVIVADGRRLDFPGPTLVEFAHLFEQYGCEVAYNLYGGAPSTMVFKGTVMNEPSGINEKPSGDIIYFN